MTEIPIEIYGHHFQIRNCTGPLLMFGAYDVPGAPYILYREDNSVLIQNCLILPKDHPDYQAVCDLLTAKQIERGGGLCLRIDDSPASGPVV